MALTAMIFIFVHIIQVIRAAHFCITIIAIVNIYTAITIYLQ